MHIIYYSVPQYMQMPHLILDCFILIVDFLDKIKFYKKYL